MPSQKIATSTSSKKETAQKREATPSAQQTAFVPQVSPFTAMRPAEILTLQRRYGNRAVQRLLANRTHQGGGIIQRLKDSDGTEITKEMVETAVKEVNIPKLEAWAKLDHDWDDDVYELVEKRLAELKSAPKETSTTPEVTSSVGKDVVPVPSLPVVRSPREVFEESLPKHLPKREIMRIYDANPGLAASVRDQYAVDSNPRLPESLLIQLAQASLLWLNWLKYRESTGGQNGMIYKFWLSPSGGSPVGEWHVHWQSGKKAGSPGWKIGRQGEKSGGDNITVMKELIGETRWGVVKGDSGSRVRLPG
jgi:hypothetical protein